MRRVEVPKQSDPGGDTLIPGGCMLCGGDLSLRVTPGGVGTVCTACRWISRPHMHREDGAVHVIHPAGLVG